MAALAAMVGCGGRAVVGARPVGFRCDDADSLTDWTLTGE